MLIARPAGAALHVRADRRRRADELQRPGEPRYIYSFDGFTLHNWLNPCEGPAMCDALWLQHPDRPAGDPRSPPCSAPWPPSRWCATHFRRPVGRQPADLPADGRSRDRPRLVAARPVRAAPASPAAGLLDDPHRAHHVLPVVRGGDRAVPAGGHGRHPRAGGQRTSTRPRGRPSGGSPSRWCFPGILGAALLASRCPSTTSSSPTSTPGRRRRSRCTSGAPPSAAYRCR